MHDEIASLNKIDEPIESADLKHDDNFSPMSYTTPVNQEFDQTRDERSVFGKKRRQIEHQPSQARSK